MKQEANSEATMNIQWYPGHMTKTRRMIEADVKLVDAVCEILDARIPLASRNPDIDAICGTKPRMIILNRIDMADPAMTKRWAEHFRARGYSVLQTDCKTKKGISGFVPAVRELLAEKLARYAEKGQVGRPLKLMIVGIPNVGKSTFINQVAGRKGAKAENRPGVTRGKQWITVDQGLLLLDTPGILWPKFEDPEVGMMLAYTGAVKDENGESVMKPWWDMTEKDIDACLKATTWPCANLGYFRGGGFSSSYSTQGVMPCTFARVNYIKHLGPTIQIIEGYTVELPEEVNKTLLGRTDPTWPSTWFAPITVPDKVAASDVYNVMANWGANHGCFVYGHIGEDLVTMASMLRIPVSLHNLSDERLFRPHAWSAFGTSDLEGADYRACATYGALYK